MRLAEYVICACSTFHLVQNEVVCFVPQSQGTGTEKSPMLCRQREQERFDVVVAKANCGFKWSLWELWKHATMDRSWRFLNTLEPKLPQLQEEGLRCYKKMDCDATFSVDYDHYEDSWFLRCVLCNPPVKYGRCYGFKLPKYDHHHKFNPQPVWAKIPQTNKNVF